MLEAIPMRFVAAEKVVKGAQQSLSKRWTTHELHWRLLRAHMYTPSAAAAVRVRQMSMQCFLFFCYFSEFDASCGMQRRWRGQTILKVVFASEHSCLVPGHCAHLHDSVPPQQLFTESLSKTSLAARNLESSQMCLSGVKKNGSLSPSLFLPLSLPPSPFLSLRLSACCYEHHHTGKSLLELPKTRTTLMRRNEKLSFLNFRKRQTYDDALGAPAPSLRRIVRGAVPWFPPAACARS